MRLKFGQMLISYRILGKHDLTVIIKEIVNMSDHSDCAIIIIKDYSSTFYSILQSTVLLQAILYVLPSGFLLILNVEVE